MIGELFRSRQGEGGSAGAYNSAACSKMVLEDVGDDQGGWWMGLYLFFFQAWLMVDDWRLSGGRIVAIDCTCCWIAGCL